MKEIGRHLNIGELGVSQASCGIAFKLSQNEQLTKKGEHNRGQVRLMKNEDLSPLSTRNG